MNDLVQIFNAGHDWAVKRKADGHYLPAPSKEKATHQLRCTRWNQPPPKDRNTKKVLREEAVWRRRQGDYALSVLAIPLHRRPEPRKLSQTLKAPVVDPPLFQRRGSLAGQRAVLSAMVSTHAHPTAMRRKIRTMGAEHLYRLYRVLRRASQRAARRLKRKARRA